PSLKGRGEKEPDRPSPSNEAQEASPEFTPLPFREGGTGGVGSPATSSRIHFPRRRSPSNRAPVTSAFHAGFHGRRSFCLLCRTPVTVRPASSGRRSRTMVSTSGSSGMNPSSNDGEFYQPH